MYKALLVLSLSACTAASDDTATKQDTTTEDVAENGLPVGASTWSGDVVVNGINFLLALELENDGGDLSGTATMTEAEGTDIGFGTGVYSFTGTHEPGSGLIALAPEDWIQEPNLTVELLGLSGHFDPDSDTIVGGIADYASSAENFLSDGPTTLTHDSGDGAALDFGALDKALPTESRSFSGTFQCTSNEREVEGELSYDGAGALTGSVTFGDYTLAEGAQTFSITGVHNPTTGGITLVPGLFTQTTDHSLNTFFVEATYDPATDRFDGELRVNTGSCPDDLWQVGF